MNNLLNLYPHNLEGYDDVKKAYQEGKKIVSEVRATGTGKSYINLQFALDNQDKKGIYVVPSLSIIEHLKEIVKENSNVSLSDFSHVDFRTYQSFVNMSYDEIKNLACDFLIVDELHHLNGPVWENRISKLIETHPDIKVLGTTAYTVVSRGTSYERDMALTGGNEIFSDSIVSRYDLCDAIIDGVLPKPIYKSAYIHFSSELSDIERSLESSHLTTKEYQEYQLILDDLKRKIHEAPTIADVLKKNLKPDGKYYYFCPVKAEEGINDIETIKKQMLENLKGKYEKEDIVFYTTTSEMGELGKKNRDAFYHDKTLDGQDCSNKLRIMFAINQYNEGVHAPGVDGVIEGRMTNSDIVFFEHIGRALAVRGDNQKRKEELEKYSSEELLQMCHDRDIFVKENISKEEMIEKLLSPLIIDLTCNYEWIKELEDNLKNRLKENTGRKNNTYQRRKLIDASFDIEVENIDLFSSLMELKNRLNNSWNRMYEYARIYYEHHGNLEVPQKFKTNNGFEYDEEGKIKLGKWIARQRSSTLPESEQGRLLSQIGMRFFNKNSTLSWEEMYEYARIYYEHHKSLEIPRSFKTNNGFEYDDAGKINLGHWLFNQRQNTLLESERGRLLSQIGMRFESKKSTLSWEEMYEYACIYYEHHGNLEVFQKFKTNNGFEYDEEGKIKLGAWIARQRITVSRESERGKLLSQIGMRFFNKKSTLSWEEMYEYACIYYEHHGNLEVFQKFKTNNGFEYDEEGKIKLGAWIARQRITVSRESERGKLLSQIGMRFFNKKSTLSWEEMYEYACIYYEHHGNLEVFQKFKTNNGFEYDEEGIVNLGTWIVYQRKTVSRESERGKLLSQIGMRFESKKSTLSWEEMYEYACQYYEHYGNLEVPQKFKTSNGFAYDETGKINLGRWIEKQRNKISPESEQGRLLLSIGMRFENKKCMMSWMEMYVYAAKYYKHHGDLEVPAKFKTNNGFEYEKEGKVTLGRWIVKQKQDYYQQKVLSDEQIILLEQIGMKWMSEKVDNKLQQEEITEKNTRKKQIELLNRTKSLLNHIGNQDFGSKEDVDRVNQKFVDELNRKSR